MQPRVTMITLGVDDLEKAVAFYQHGLRLKTQGIQGTEFEHGAVAFFDLQPGLKLALWPRASIAHDTGLSRGPISATEFTIAHNVGSKEEVDAVMAEAAAAWSHHRESRARHLLGRLLRLFPGPGPTRVGSGLESVHDVLI